MTILIIKNKISIIMCIMFTLPAILNANKCHKMFSTVKWKRPLIRLNRNCMHLTRQYGYYSINRVNCFAHNQSLLSVVNSYLIKHQRFNTTKPMVSLGDIYETISKSLPVEYTQKSLVAVHDFTGLPWWATIIFSTVLFRTLITLPLTIYQHRILSRLDKIRTEMSDIVTKLKREISLARNELKWSELETRVVYNRTVKKRWSELIIRENCHPAKTLVVLWGQIPLWICISMSLRNLIHILPDPTDPIAQITYTELTLGGFGWIPNLTDVDYSYILPVLLGLINLSGVEVQSMLRVNRPTRLQKIVTHIFRGASIIIIPIACTVPSALALYWVISSSYGLIQNLVLISPAVKSALRISNSSIQLEHPYEHIWLCIKQRLLFDSNTLKDGEQMYKKTSKFSKKF